MCTDIDLLYADADPYIPGGNGAQWYVNQNNFFRSIRNFVIDLTQTPATATSTGIHWQVSQATSIVNVVFEMSTDPNTAHQGTSEGHFDSGLLNIEWLPYRYLDGEWIWWFHGR